MALFDYFDSQNISKLNLEHLLIDAKVLNGLSDLSFGSSWLHSNWSTSDSQSYQDQLQEASLNTLLGEWQLTEGLVQSSGDQLVPASGAAVPMRELVFQQSVRLVGEKIEANDGVIDIWQVELPGRCEAWHTTRNRESVCE